MYKVKHVIFIVVLMACFLFSGCGNVKEKAVVESILVNDQQLENFSVKQHIYTYLLPEDTTEIPVVTAVKGKGLGELVVEQADDITGEASVSLNGHLYKICFVKKDTASMLDNTYYRLKVEKELRIAYFGGSVTNGYGASNPGKTSWRAITTLWLRESFPDAKITDFDASVGGTGTEYAAYRAVQDLKLQSEKDCPDLVFIEFSINDMYDGSEGKNAELYAESIVKTIYQYSPTTEIVFVLTTDFSRQNTCYMAMEKHINVAEAYQVPYISVGSKLWDEIVAENGEKEPPSTANPVWRKYFTDIVHPTDAGYKKYAGYITEYLADLFEQKEIPSELTNAFCPIPSLTTLLVEPHITDFSNHSLAVENLLQSEDGSIESHTSGTRFSFEFIGTELKFMVYATPEGGTLNVTIDGVASHKVDLSKNTANYKVVSIAEGLDKGTHRVDIELQESSAGTHMDIRDILISGGQKEGINIVE